MLLFLPQFLIAQKNCPSKDLQGKWKSENYGINIECGKITLLDKLNNWDLSGKREDTYYIVETITSQDGKFVCSVRNFTKAKILTEYHTVQNMPTIQYRIFKLEINENGLLDFSLSEKSVKVANMERANWTAIREEKDLFEAKFTLTKYNQ